MFIIIVVDERDCNNNNADLDADNDVQTFIIYRTKKYFNCKRILRYH